MADFAAAVALGGRVAAGRGLGGLLGAVAALEDENGDEQRICMMIGAENGRTRWLSEPHLKQLLGFGSSGQSARR